MTKPPAPSGKSSRRSVEWPTLAMMVLTYGLWAFATTSLAAWFLPASIILATLTAALHSSLSHEALHGHPFRNRHLNAALVFPALSVAVPYMRFRDTHLAHHTDATLTDPYDDPESNYLDPQVWSSLPAWKRKTLSWNNTLAGRMVLGPLIGQIAFMKEDWEQIRKGNTRVLISWLWHIPAVGLVIWWMVAIGKMPLWAWAISVYAALSLLKIRTYLEHQAHERARGRTVVVEDQGWLALLFLNNNFHVVHHMHPRIPWYALPKLYFENRARYLGCNLGYRFNSYREVFARYFWRAKDPVPHPLWRRD